MKFKSLLYFGVAVLGLSMTACSEDDAKYTPADPSEAPEAYFSPMNSTDYELGETDTQIVVKVYRSEPGEALTVPVACTSNAPTLFTCPASVTFATGDTETDYVVTFDATQLQGAYDYTFDIKLGDGVDTPYALQTVKCTAVYFPWEDVVGPNGETEGRWVDNMVGQWYGQSFLGAYWPVKIQKSPAIDGLYRVVNPYEYFAAAAGAESYDNSTPHYLYFNVKDPDGAFFCSSKGGLLESDGSCVIFQSGMTIATDGHWQLAGVANIFAWVGNSSKAAENLGTFKDGILKFPPKAIAIGESEYNGGIEGGLAKGSYTSSNADGAFRIIFPGCKEEQPEEPEQWKSLGEGQYTDAAVTPLYGMAPQTWAVEIQKDTQNEGIYRLVNPYKAGVMIVNGQNAGTDYSGDVYIEFDIADPSCALLDLQLTGFVDEDSEEGAGDGLGRIAIANLASNFVADGKTISEIVAAGFADPYDAATRTVTFAVHDFSGEGACNLRVFLADATEGSEYYNKLLSATDKPGKIVIPAEEAEAAAAKTCNYTGALQMALRSNGLKAVKSFKSTRRYELGKKVAKHSFRRATLARF